MPRDAQGQAGFADRSQIIEKHSGRAVQGFADMSQITEKANSVDASFESIEKAAGGFGDAVFKPIEKVQTLISNLAVDFMHTDVGM
ncbi:hypothetical protein T492DRAFT_876206 [Pavlovales sp. CCMP2436]|nr:hypothetical protein T492DRAFT_876206 [Pavlovales sp. CCMP2436]